MSNRDTRIHVFCTYMFMLCCQTCKTFLHKLSLLVTSTRLLRLLFCFSDLICCVNLVTAMDTHVSLMNKPQSAVFCFFFVHGRKQYWDGSTNITVCNSWTAAHISVAHPHAHNHHQYVFISIEPLLLWVTWHAVFGNIYLWNLSQCINIRYTHRAHNGNVVSSFALLSVRMCFSQQWLYWWKWKWETWCNIYSSTMMNNSSILRAAPRCSVKWKHTHTYCSVIFI